MSASSSKCHINLGRQKQKVGLPRVKCVLLNISHKYKCISSGHVTCKLLIIKLLNDSSKYKWIKYNYRMILILIILYSFIFWMCDTHR